MNNKKYVLKLDKYKYYLDFIKKVNIEKNCKWIYDIIDKNKDNELNKILYENKKFILVLSFEKKANKINTFHLLAFSKDKTIKSIRDLKIDHIPLLK